MIAALFMLVAGCTPAPENGASPQLGAEGGSPPPAFHADRTPPPAQGTPTRNGKYLVAWEPVPAPIPTSALFEVRVTLRDAKTVALVSDAKVRVDARMPQHGHGMATRPVDDPGVCAGSGDAMTCTHPDGIYLTRGMKFHMPGEWTLTISIEGPAGNDHLDVRTTL